MGWENDAASVLLGGTNNGRVGPSTAAYEASGVDPVTCWLSLDCIDDSPYQPRLRPHSKRDVEDLTLAMAAAGQITPIIVAPSATPERFVVHSGHRRCAALRFLGEARVLAIVRTDLDERAARRLALADNLGRQDLTPYEQAKALGDYCESCGLSAEEAALELGLGRRTGFRLQTILKASDDMLQALREHGLSIRASELLVKLEGKSPRRALRLAAKHAKGRVSVEQLEAELRKAAHDQRPGVGPSPRDVVFSADDHRINLRVSIVRRLQTEDQRERVAEAVAQLLRQLGISQVAAASEVSQ